MDESMREPNAAGRGAEPFSRRSMLGRAAVVGGAVWLPPTLLSTAAHAQGSTPTTTEPVGFSPVAVGGTGQVAALGGIGDGFYVVDAAGNLRRTADAGTTWTDPTAGGTVGLAPLAIVGSPSGPVLAISAGGVVHSSPAGGASWTPETGISPAPVVVTPSVAPGDNAYAVVADGTMRGRPGWSTVGSTVTVTPVAMAGTFASPPGGTPPPHLHLLAVDAVGDLRLRTAAFTSGFPGSFWVYLWTPPAGSLSIQPVGLAVGSLTEGSVPATWLAVNASGQVQIGTSTTPFGFSPSISWSAPSTIAPGIDVVGIAGLDGQHLVVASDGRCWRSSDGGVTWTEGTPIT